MPRQLNPDLIVKWKLSMPATLAGRIEYLLLDPITKKPIYSARQRLVSALLERWLWDQSDTAVAPAPQVPSIEELRAL